MRYNIAMFMLELALVGKQEDLSIKTHSRSGEFQRTSEDPKERNPSLSL